MYILSVILIAAIVFVDQITKFLVIKNIALGEVISVIKFGDTPIFSLTHVRNRGAAWSSFSDKTLFLTIFTFIVILFFIALMYLKPLRMKLIGKEAGIVDTVILSLVIAGGIGNLIDRIRLGEVVDFIKTDFISFPIFNVADICITVGEFMFIIFVIALEFKKPKKAEKNDG